MRTASRTNMARVHALSFDMQACLEFAFTARAEHRNWGIAWYPEGEAAATVIKNPTATQLDESQSASNLWRRLRSTVFLLQSNDSTRRATPQDCQPFVRGFGRRDIACLISGEVSQDLNQALKLSADSTIEPIGRTPAEHAFCWLLTQLNKSGAKTLKRGGWNEILMYLRTINEFGPVSILVSDGAYVLAYRDSQARNTLHYLRCTPPHQDMRLIDGDFDMGLSDLRDSSRTYMAFATHPCSKQMWLEHEPGELVVTRGGKIVWSSSSKLTQEQAATARTAEKTQRGIAVQESLEASVHPILGPVRSVLAPQAMAFGRPELTHAESTNAMRILTVEHETVYEYSDTVESSVHLLRLRPVHDARQDVLLYSLTLEPQGALREYEDVFGNQSARLQLSSPYQRFRLLMRAKVRIKTDDDQGILHERATIPLVWMPWQRQMMHAYLLPLELPETQLQELTDFAMSFVTRQDHDLISALQDMNRTIFEDFQYVSGSTTLETTPYDVFVQRRGVCQDFANLFICMARLLGIPARYRVGYIHTSADYENQQQSDASHAWAEIYLPSTGWRGFDPTNGCQTNPDHIRVACGRNYRDATPTSGTIFGGGGTETLSVSVKVIDENAGISATDA